MTIASFCDERQVSKGHSSSKDWSRHCFMDFLQETAQNVGHEMLEHALPELETERLLSPLGPAAQETSRSWKAQSRSIPRKPVKLMASQLIVPQTARQLSKLRRLQLGQHGGHRRECLATHFRPEFDQRSATHPFKANSTGMTKSRQPAQTAARPASLILMLASKTTLEDKVDRSE